VTVKLIGLIRLVDQVAFDEYRGKVGQTVEKFRGRVTWRGSVVQCYWNELACDAFDSFVELEFPTLEDSARWVGSEDYGKLLDVRSRAMRLTLLAIE